MLLAAASSVSPAKKPYDLAYRRLALLPVAKSQSEAQPKSDQELTFIHFHRGWALVSQGKAPALGQWQLEPLLSVGLECLRSEPSCGLCTPKHFCSDLMHIRIYVNTHTKIRLALSQEFG